MKEVLEQAPSFVHTLQKCCNLFQDSLQTSRLADLKDLWRIVQVDVEKECLDSQVRDYTICSFTLDMAGFEDNSEMILVF